MFLFKLHAPRNVIVGGGIFAYANVLPCSLVWEAFKEANGARSEQEMRARIAQYRRAGPGDRNDFNVGCRILTQPFFFVERDWIPVPASWSRNIVSFKTYNTDNDEGLDLWEAVNDRLYKSQMVGIPEERERFSENRISFILASDKVRSVCWSRISIGGVARSPKSEHCRLWRRRIYAHMAMVARTRRRTDYCCGGTFTACSTPAM